jgi:hypothetical protein
MARAPSYDDASDAVQERRSNPFKKKEDQMIGYGRMGFPAAER